MVTPSSVVAISGASSGIGEACALHYACLGYRLLLGARRQERLEQLAIRCHREGAEDVLSQSLDVRDQSSIDLFVKAGLSHFGSLDILINNAGLAAGLAPLAEGRDEDWEAMIETNVMGLLRLTRAVLPSMLARNAGHVVNVGSIAGFQTYANGSVYAGSKHAVRAISGALRLELCGTAIRVSEVDPGMVETEFSLVRLADAAKAKAVYEGFSPLTATDVAECIAFATSRPAHVNVDHIIVMPVAQASVYRVHRMPTN